MKIIPSRCTRALTIIEVLVVIVILAVLAGLLLPSPHYSSRERKRQARQINCVNNLKQVGLAFRMWANDHGGNYPMHFQTNGFDGESFASQRMMYVYFQVMSNELITPKVVACTADEQRSAASDFTTNFNSGTVSYFVGLDAKEDLPQSILAGDRNVGDATGAGNNTPPADYGYSSGTGGGYIVLGTNNTVVAWSDKMHRRQGDIVLGDGSVQRVTTARLREALRNTGSQSNRLVFP